MKQPILIVSPPRSGSSLLAMILAKSGVFTGFTKPGDGFNIYGYYENIKITKLVVDHLRTIDNGRGKKFQPVNLDMDIPFFRDKVFNILSTQGMRDLPWLYKDPKIALTWKLFHKTFPKAKWVILSRDEKQTLNSYKRTEFMDAYQSKKEWEQYLMTFKYNIKGMKEQVDFIDFRIEDIFTNNEAKINELYDYVGVKNVGAHLLCYDSDAIKK